MQLGFAQKDKGTNNGLTIGGITDLSVYEKLWCSRADENGRGDRTIEP